MRSHCSLHQTRCAILPISSLLATLVTIPVLLTRLFATCTHRHVRTNPSKSLFNKTAIVSSVAKSDEIGKKAHLVWCKEVSRDFVN